MLQYIYDADKIITQGGILKDLTIPVMGQEGEVIGINLSYAIIISQACDIEQNAKENKENYYLPSILVLPMYILENFKDGSHLIQCGHDVRQGQQKNKKEIDKIKKNSEIMRYHFLPKYDSLLLHDTVIDFKQYFTISSELITSLYQSKYIATLNLLYKELLSQRFCNYLCRIGLPSTVESEE